MPWKTPQEEAVYALDYGVDRSELTVPGQLAYDQIKAARETDPTYQPTDEFPPEILARTSPETRARILEIFKRINPKYAKPFERAGWPSSASWAATGRSTARSFSRWPSWTHCSPLKNF